MKLKKAFTLAEAILTMTILGVLAATMVSNLKPAQYRKKALVTKAQKMYAEIDQAANMIISECTQASSLASTYKACDRSTGAVARTSLTAAETKALFARYLKLVGSCTKSDYDCGLTKNNVCACFKNDVIFIDVNNGEGPNASGEDQHSFDIDDNGLASAMPDYAVAASN